MAKGTTVPDEERKAKLRKAYGQATTELRELHKDEFNNLYSKAAGALGVEWTPRPDAEQKAEQAFDQLLLDFPHLRERITEAQQTG